MWFFMAKRLRGVSQLEFETLNALFVPQHLLERFAYLIFKLACDMFLKCCVVLRSVGESALPACSEHPLYS
jgi:hypothetical protein